MMANPDQEFEPLATASEPVEQRTGVESSPAEETRLEDAQLVSKPAFHQAVRSGQLPERIGRFRIEKKLGKGSFGAVYLGRDESGQLAAVKIAEFKPGTNSETVRRIQQTLLQEAEAARHLQHAHIVKLLDFHLPDDHPDEWFLVYAYIDGGTLKDRLKSGPLDPLTATTMMAKLADALYVAHRQKLIHRDIKPANIMLDSRGEPYLADFGLAVTESEMLRREDTAAGTPLYYSPEQADGEPHLVTYRTDIYSLGATLYEMLVGKPPFADHRNSEQLKRLILETPPRSLQLENPSLPDALDHICQRALRKRQDERYRHAGEMAQELREVQHTLQAQPAVPTIPSSLPLNVPTQSTTTTNSTVQGSVTAGQSTVPGVAATASVTASGSMLGMSVRDTVAEADAALSQVEPKGLRSFDKDDADYFLHLLPGTRDRTGLPMSISVWKRQIEQTHREETFAVGLMYGPSGCGKSSLVKAGLIPRLAPTILPVYLEATPTGTEDRIRQLVIRECPGAFDQVTLGSVIGTPDTATNVLPLNELLKSVRRDPSLRKRRKLLIVIDQFEQWLHVNRSEMRTTELVRALRQADGENLQFLLLIREDFWVPTSRLFHELEIPLIDGVNSRLVDLFDLPHARRVLHAFGAAYQRLPPLNVKLSAPQEHFLDDAVTGMSEDRRVICVRLSLFSDMLREREWTPATLREVGGAAGVGVAFLEETFGSQARHPELRHFEKPVRGVLKALLPEVGTDIKGQRRSRDDLQAAADLTHDSARFQRLLDILDRELRIITPVAEEGESSASDSPASATSYQLAHDYLVPSIRDWLTRKQRETWRGRAELALAERTIQWLRTRERRFFPSVAEYVAIQAGVPRHRRSSEQRQLMTAARRWYGSLLLLIVLAIGSLAGVAWEINGRTQGRRLAQQIVSAVPSELPRLLDDDLPGYRRWADPLLREHLTSKEEGAASSPMQLRASLALLDVDDSQTEFLAERLLDCAFEEFPIIRDRLAKSSKRVERLIPKLSPIFKGTEVSSATSLRARLKAGMALASWNEKGDWAESDFSFLAERLTAENPIHQAVLLDALRPLATKLTPILEVRFRDVSLRETERSAAASALADFAAKDAERIANLLTDAEPAQYEILFPLAALQRDAVLPIFRQIAAREPTPELTDVERIALGKQRAGAAVSLMRLKDAAHAFEALRVRDDPEARTQFAHRQRARGVTPDELLDALDTAASESSVRFGLLVALGEFALDDIPAARREPLVARLEDWYRHDPLSSIHGAVGWLLRTWRQTKVVTEVDQTPLPFDPTGKRDWFVDVVRGEAGGQPFVDGFTFVVFSPGEFEMGSPLSEKERSTDEAPHRVRLTRPIAFCDREISASQWKHFADSTGSKVTWSADQSPTLAHPMNSATWYDAVRYCRWLSQASGRSEGEQCYDDPMTLKSAEGAAANAEPADWSCQFERSGYRLPTEAEWEYASRSGMRSSYGFASDRAWVSLYANYLDTSGNKTRISGELRPNSRGLFDMHGNILEWCHDWFAAYDTSAIQVDPHGPAKSPTRVLRGGSWSSAARDSRSADRHDYPPVFRGYRVGFRIVQLPDMRTATIESK